MSLQKDTGEAHARAWRVRFPSASAIAASSFPVLGMQDAAPGRIPQGEPVLISEVALGVRAEDLARIAQLNLAASALYSPAAEFREVEFYRSSR